MTYSINETIIALMKKVLSLCLFLIFFSSLLMAQTSEEERRIEEEKRQSLHSTEERIFEKRELGFRPTDSTELGYFRELLSRRVIFHYDACRALVILMGVENQYKDLNAQIAFLKEKNIIPRKTASEFDPNEPLRKGLAAYMFCRALEIKGGLWLRLFDKSQRYALRELVFEGIMSPGNVNDIVSGKELILILTTAANYKAKRLQAAE